MRIASGGDPGAGRLSNFRYLVTAVNTTHPAVPFQGAVVDFNRDVVLFRAVNHAVKVEIEVRVTQMAKRVDTATFNHIDQGFGMVFFVRGTKYRLMKAGNHPIKMLVDGWMNIDFALSIENVGFHTTNDGNPFKKTRQDTLVGKEPIMWRTWHGFRVIRGTEHR